jgi:tetratricopeptide (TPR) repeat protein
MTVVAARVLIITCNLAVLGALEARAQQRQEQPSQNAPTQRGEQPKSSEPTRPGDPKKAEPQRKAAPGGQRAPAMPKALSVEKHASPADQRRQLEDLYAQLQTAPDAPTAQKHVAAIERVWQAQTGDTALVLIERAGLALAAKDTALALDFLNEAVRLAPDKTEPWVRRAYFHAADNNIRAAIGDLRRVIALDPDHFRALHTLASLLREVNERPAALRFARQAKELHPFLDGINTMIDELSRSVEGQGT